MVMGILVVILAQSCLIAGLLWQQSRRRDALPALDADERALRLSHEHARRIAGRVIAAQEVERARIARELHDDLSQKVAMLIIDIRQISQCGGAAMMGKLGLMAERAAELGTDLHNLSYELHPAKLRFLGLVKATQCLCRDVAVRHSLDIAFTHERMPAIVAPDRALCLYRIVQEALQNVVKHSGASRAVVRLTGAPDSLKLEISDSGGGFDTSKPRDGIGLLSMRERVNLLNGSVTVESAPGSGTRITVRVPANEAAAAGDHVEARIA